MPVTPNEIDITKYLPGLLVVGGATLQWVRQYKGMHDSVVMGVFPVVLAAGMYLLCADYSLEWRRFVLELLIWLPGGTGAVIGGTFTAARVAAAGSGDGPIPQTNTK